MPAGTGAESSERRRRPSSTFSSAVRYGIRPGLLGDERHLAAAQLGALGAIERAELLPADRDLAFVRAVEPGEHVQERRLAAPGAADERRENAPVEASGEPGEDDALAVAAADAGHLGRDLPRRRGCRGPGLVERSRGGAASPRHDGREDDAAPVLLDLGEARLARRRGAVRQPRPALARDHERRLPAG